MSGLGRRLRRSREEIEEVLDSRSRKCCWEETEEQMEAAGASEERRRTVCILGSELVENYTVIYILQCISI